MVHLLKSYRLPFLLYASEAVLPSPRNLQTLGNCINRAVFNLFCVGSSDCILTIWCRFYLPSICSFVEKKTFEFIHALINDSQWTCWIVPSRSITFSCLCLLLSFRVLSLLHFMQSKTCITGRRFTCSWTTASVRRSVSTTRTAPQSSLHSPCVGGGSLSYPSIPSSVSIFYSLFTKLIN